VPRSVYCVEIEFPKSFPAQERNTGVFVVINQSIHSGLQADTLVKFLTKDFDCISKDLAGM